MRKISAPTHKHIQGSHSEESHASSEGRGASANPWMSAHMHGAEVAASTETRHHSLPSQRMDTVEESELEPWMAARLNHTDKDSKQSYQQAVGENCASQEGHACRGTEEKHAGASKGVNEQDLPNSNATLEQDKTGGQTKMQLE